MLKLADDKLKEKHLQSRYDSITHRQITSTAYS